MSTLFRNRAVLLCLVFCIPSKGWISAQSIQVSLDLYYTNPADTRSGGSWELVALGTNRGIAGLVPSLEGITNRNRLEAPHGTAVGVERVGFSPAEGTNDFWFDFGDYTQFGFVQSPELAGNPQGLFYDVGVPGGAKSPGENGTPEVAGLMAETGVPWNYDDILGDFLVDQNPGNDNGDFHDAVLLARGTFEPGASPGFSSSAPTAGTIFAAIGSESIPPLSNAIVSAAVTEQVRDNTSMLAGDANGDGFVDVSDFNIWNANKLTNAAGYRRGDFNADQVIDVSDFNIWNANKFRSVAVVPEPGQSLWAFIGVVVLRRFGRRLS